MAKSFHDRRRGDRRGAVLVFALVCLAVAALLLMSILRTAGGCHRISEASARQLQAVWLAESAIDRAAARLAADADYSGETWTLSPEDFGGRDGAIVTIEVERIPDEPDRRLVRVRADYPNHPHHRAREEKQVMVDAGL